MRILKRIFSFFLLVLLSFPIYAWNHGIDIGYGSSTEIDSRGYHNHGYLLSADILSIKQIDSMLRVTLNASVGNWYASTRCNKHLITTALSAAFRAYFFPPLNRNPRPYLLTTFGPSYLSTRHFGLNTQGANFAFQITLGGGIEIGKNNKGLDLNLRLVHYCNAGLAKPNESFNILYLFSVGYLF